VNFIGKQLVVDKKTGQVKDVYLSGLIAMRFSKNILIPV